MSVQASNDPLRRKTDWGKTVEKEPEKLATIRGITKEKAIDISAQSFKEILPLIKPGVSERGIGAKLDYLLSFHQVLDGEFGL